MALDDIVKVKISLKAASVVAAGFGVPLILGPANAWSERYKVYTDPADMLDDGFTSSDAEYKAAVDLMSQDETPESFVIGRRLAVVTQIDTFTPVVADDTDYTLTLNGTELTINSGGSATATTIVTALIAAVNGDSDLAAVLTASGSTTLVVTSDVPGLGFSASVPDSNLALVASAVNHGIADDISQIRNAGAVFYGVAMTSRSVNEIKQAAAYAEGNSAEVPMFFLGQTSESTSASAALNSAGTDLLNVLHHLQYKRTAVLWHALDGEFADAAWLGRELPVDPGSDNWALKILRGISPDNLSAGSKLNILAKDGNVYYPLTVDNPITYEGKVASGDWIDVIRFIDFLKARISEAVANLMLTSEKVEFDDRGLSLVGAQVKGVLQAAKDARKLVEFSVIIPRAADIPALNRAARILSPPITFVAQLSGALNGVNVEGTVTE